MATVSSCCLQGFEWDGKPVGREDTLGDSHPAYVTGSNSDVAILLIHDLFGWTFVNTRLLADHYAREADATVYVPDLLYTPWKRITCLRPTLQPSFGGEVIPSTLLMEDRWREIDLPGIHERNNKTIRSPEIFHCARVLRSQYKRIGAVGFCFGGWAVFQLGAKENEDLVDCISAGHPTWLEESEIEKVGVPVQLIASEIDQQFTPELKAFSNSVIPTLGVPYDYQYFPGLEHAFATRGNPKKEGERKGMIRAKNAAVYWFRQWLHPEE